MVIFYGLSRNTDLVRTKGTMDKSELVSHARRVNSVLSSQMDSLRPGTDRYVARSWYRCANDYHLDPLRPGETPVVERHALLERMDAAGELLRIATEESRNIYAHTRGSGYIIAVTDSDGVILSWIGDPTLDKQFADSGIRTGAIWDERHRGTNGMGTCLAEGSAVTIHNEDHFFVSHANLTCTGVPIHNTSGEVAAILDASSLNAPGDKASQIYTSALLQMSANRIEHCFFIKSYGNEIILRINRWAELIGTIDDALIALDPTGRILAVNDVTLDQLQVTGRDLLIGRNLEDVLDVRLEQLLAAHYESGNVPVTVHTSGAGAPFFVIAREPSHKAKRSPRCVGSRPAAGDPPSLSLDELAGADPGMRANVYRARHVLNKAVPVLLIGETGTGKNAFARALHNESDRCDQPFVSLNCATLSGRQLAEQFSEWQWQPPSATDEAPDVPCDTWPGTLFLDEIGEMNEELQSQFLTLLEELLETESPNDPDDMHRLHIVSSTKRNLDELVDRGEFRKDLYYRLYGLQIDLVPLAKRTDLEQIIQDVLERENRTGKPVRLTNAAMERLRTHPWDGNFRELHLVLRTSLAMSHGNEIRVEHLPEAIGRRHDAAPESRSNGAGGQSEKDALIDALQRNRWNVSKTAVMLKISRNTLYRKMNQFRIPKKTD